MLAMDGVSAHYRRIAGNLELFCGAYFVAAGTLAAIYFRRLHHPRVAMIAGAGALFGILLLARASRLLGWRRWLFWTVATISVAAPLVWLLPPLLS